MQSRLPLIFVWELQQRTLRRLVISINIFHLSFQGAGFAAFGQAKPVVTPFGQVAAVGVSSNPFMVSEFLRDINFCMSEEA